MIQLTAAADTGHEHTQTHTDETECLYVRVFLQTDKTHDGSGYRTGPDKDKETPAPVALLAQRYQCQWRVASRDMPINSRMIPLAQTFLPLRMMLHRVVERGGRIRAQHAEEIEDHTPPCPVVIALETPDEEDDAEHHSHQNPAAVRRSIPYLFPFRISDHLGYGLFDIDSGAKIQIFLFSLFTFHYFSYLCNRN